MKNNEIKIINDLDKENDDLMRHLGLLQQFSLEQETNILKDINKYNDDISNENEYVNNLKNDNNKNNRILPKKKNKKIMDMIRKKEELEKKKKDKNLNELNNKLNKNYKKNYNNNNFEILEDNEKCIININHYNKNKKENIKNNINKKENDENTSSDENISELNLNNKLIEDALNVEKKLNNNINNFNELKKQKIKKENDNKHYINNNKDEDKDEYLNERDIFEEKNKLNLEKDIIDKYSLDEEELDSPKNDDNLNEEIKNIKKYQNMINSFDDIKNDNNFIIKKENNIDNIDMDNKKLEEEIEIIKKKKNIINNVVDNNINNKSKYKEDKENNNNFVCDLDIFKKLQKQMNKKSEILQKTIEKYNHKPKKIEIINEAKPIQSKINSYKNEIDIDNNYINNKNNNIKEEIIPEKKLFNNNNLIEKINNIRNKIGNDLKLSNNNDKDIYLKNEIKSSNSSYESLIFKIPSLLLDNKIEEIEIYIKLEMIYYKLKTITNKLDFISLLRQVLNNILMLKNASFNVYMNLFNFILTLQIYELNLSDCNPSLPCEYLKSLLDLLINNKDLTDMIRIIIFLIKKYFPINMLAILEQKTIVILKVLNSYLKQLNNVILSAYINIKSIFIEINDFLFFSPPSLLTDEFPLAELYMEIYEEIRNTTDNIIKSCKTKIMKKELIDAVIFIKSKIKNPSLDYVNYLDYAIYKIN